MLKFYDVDKRYIDYLKTIEPKIPNISYANSDKFVCGVVMSVNGKDYFVPVSSFNTFQATNFLIYNSKGAAISSLRFCFMFPLPSAYIFEKDFTQITDARYKSLLQEEYTYIVKNEKAIFQKAQKVYKIGCNKGHYLNRNCCDFLKLEAEASDSGYQKFLNP